MEITKKPDKFKPCPFCGEDECFNDIMYMTDYADEEGYEVECIVCGHCGVRFLMDGEDFNKRKGAR